MDLPNRTPRSHQIILPGPIPDFLKPDPVVQPDVQTRIHNVLNQPPIQPVRNTNIKIFPGMPKKIGKVPIKPVLPINIDQVNEITKQHLNTLAHGEINKLNIGVLPEIDREPTQLNIMSPPITTVNNLFLPDVLFPPIPTITGTTATATTTQPIRIGSPPPPTRVKLVKHTDHGTKHMTVNIGKHEITPIVQKTPDTHVHQEHANKMSPCKICYDDQIGDYPVMNCCKQIVCLDCQGKFRKAECPFCRATLTNVGRKMEQNIKNREADDKFEKNMEAQEDTAKMLTNFLFEGDDQTFKQYIRLNFPDLDPSFVSEHRQLFKGRIYKQYLSQLITELVSPI